MVSNSQINTRHALAYGIGGAPYAVKEAAFTLFVLLFYTQVLGLSGTATGVVLFISLLWDAISDPLMGAWSDRFRSRWGRRHPFMAVSALPLALGFVALFNPPMALRDDSFQLAIWLLICSLWIRTWVTVFALPHLALAAEMTGDYHQRSRLLGQRIGLLFLTSIALSALSMYFLFDEVGGQDGRFIADNYASFGWISAAVVAITALITLWGTRGFIRSTAALSSSMPDGKGMRGMLADFFSTFQSHNFRNILFFDLAASASYGITVALNVMIWTYYWEFDAKLVAVLMGLPILVSVPLAMISMKWLGQRWAKHKILNWAIFLMIVDVVWVYPLRIFDLIPVNGHWLVAGLVLLQNLLFVYLFILRNISSYSIVADITDEHESVSGKRQEGGLYSVLAFTTKLASAAGPLYAGIALDLIGLSEGMMPGTIAVATLDQLVWALLIAVVPLMIMAWHFTGKVSMSETQLLEIQSKIRSLQT